MPVISSRLMHIDQLIVRSRLLINVRVIISDFSTVYTYITMAFLMDFLKNNEGWLRPRLVPLVLGLKFSSLFCLVIMIKRILNTLNATHKDRNTHFLVSRRADFSFCSSAYGVLATVSSCCSGPSQGQVLTRYSPVRHWKHHFPFDLHVLSMPPTFILSQDRTLHEIIGKGNLSKYRTTRGCL
jgi:hypothetical protein